MIVDSLTRQVRDLAVKRITLGVTGFSRAGKTVFIGALAQALLTSHAWRERRGQGPLARFGPFERGQLKSARIRDDIHPDLPQFPFRRVRDSLAGYDARWPEPTEGISRLVLEFEAQSHSRVRSWLQADLGLGEIGLGRIQLELVDYPGEWLVDLPMLEQSFDDWSARMLALASKPAREPLSAAYLARLAALPGAPEFDEDTAGALADCWTDYLQQAVQAGLMLNQPGRLLRPDKLRHSPVLRLAPLPDALRASRLYRGMARRYDDYRAKVVKPFYGEHFAAMDRQIVLVDVLRSLQLGEAAFDEMTAALSATLESFNYGKGGLLSWLTGRTTHVLFAATKADHVTRSDRAELERMLSRMLALLDENNRLRAATARCEVMALASVRASEDRMTETTPPREILYGRADGDATPDQWDPGGLPRTLPPDWNALQFAFLRFAPAPMPDALHQGFPAIGLGQALDFLIGEDFS